MQVHEAKITEEVAEILRFKEGRVSNQFSSDELKLLVDALPLEARAQTKAIEEFLEDMIRQAGHPAMLAIKLISSYIHIGARPPSETALDDFMASVMQCVKEAAQDSTTEKAGGESSSTTEEAKQ